MIRRGALLLAAALTLLATLAIAALRPVPAATAHVSGDGAGAVLARLPGLPLAAAPEAARIEAVLLRRVGSLRHVPGLEAACRERCGGQAVTVLVRLHPLRSRKTVVIDMGRLGAGAALDAGAPPEDAAALCAASVVAAEMARLLAEAQPCAGARRQAILPPWGL